nr:hypothetical protein [Tanacetum cinerariifolium]
MGDEHLNTILEMESDEFIKSSVENLIPNPSESEDLSDSECDVPACDDFTTFSNLLFDAEDDFFSKIISIKIDPHHFNAESDLIESLLNHDSSIISSSSKIDFLLDEFTGELILLKSISLGIDETDCIEEDDYDSERDILIFEEFLSNDSLSLLENESFHFDIPSFSRPPAKPPDDDSGSLTVK